MAGIAGKPYKPYNPIMSPKDDERVELRVAPEDLKRWRVTASAEGMQLSEWIRRRCNEVAVDQELIDLVDRKLAEERALTRERAEAIARGDRSTESVLVRGRLQPKTPTARNALVSEIVDSSNRELRADKIPNMVSSNRELRADKIPNVDSRNRELRAKAPKKGTKR